MSNKRQFSRIKRHRAFLQKIWGTSERPRLIISKSLRNFSAQVIDDTAGKSLFSLSTANKEIKQKLSQAGNIKAAGEFGRICGQRLKEKGVTKIVFDRAGNLYHGRTKACAEALRKEGLEF
jgi:large subunit ribosomal protein L18